MLDSCQAQLRLQAYTAVDMANIAASSTGSIGGGRASAGTAARATGSRVSFSLEARSGFMNTSSLSAKDRGMMVNKSSFYGLDKNKGMFDRSKSVREAPKLQFSSRVSRTINTPKSIEFKSIAPKPGMIDISRAKSRTTREAPKTTFISSKNERVKMTPVPVRTSPWNRENKTVAMRTLEVGLNPRKSEQRVKSVDPFKNAVVLWQNGERRVSSAPHKTSMRVEAVASNLSKLTKVVEGQRKRAGEVRSAFERSQTRVVETGRQNNVQEDTKSQTSREHHYRTQRVEGVKNRPMKEKKARKISHMVKISSSVTPEKLAQIRHDLKDAKKTVHAIVRARHVSHAEANRELAEELEKKYSKFVKVLPQEENLPLQITRSEDQKRSLKRKQENMVALEVRERVFYVKEDVLVQDIRIKRATDALLTLIKNKKEGDEISGREIVSQMGNLGTEANSEVAKLRTDKSVTKFLAELGKLTAINTNVYLRETFTKIKQIADISKAVRLSKRESGNGASLQELEHVLGGTIQGQAVHFQEHEVSNGRIYKDPAKTYYIPQGAGMLTQA